jgi:hypothetical protein
MVLISSGQKTIFDMNDVYSSTSPPNNPTEGSLWFNKNDNKLYVYTWNASLQKYEWVFSGDGIEVGGRNLIGNTNNYNDLVGWSWAGTAGSSLVVTETTSPYGKAVQATFSATGSSGGVHHPPLSQLIGGEQYTWSVWLKGSKNMTINVGSEQGGQINCSVTTTWQKFTYTFTAQPLQTYWSFTFYVPSPAVGDKYWIHSLQLERGNIATDYNPAPEDMDAVVVDIQNKLGAYANDNIIDYSERTDIKDSIDEIIGKVIADSDVTLPTYATLDASAKGTFYATRRKAVLAGIPTTNVTYIALATKYNNLKSYVEAMSPKPWDCSTTNKDKNISVTKEDWRSNWISYYQAELDLDTLITQYIDDGIGSIQVGGRNYGLNTNFSYTTTNNSVGWDNALNGTTIPDDWAIYNSGVASPTVGYHAHINTTKFSYNVLEFNDRNTPYGATLAHRWQGASQILSGSSSFMRDMHFGDKFTISMDVYSDTVGSKMNTGIYHYKKSTGTLGFWSFQWDLAVCSTANTWEKKSYTFTIDTDWDLSKPSYIYLYGHYSTMECSQWVKNVKLEYGEKATSWTPSPEDQSKYADNAGADGESAWAKFSGTGNTLPSGAVTWKNGTSSDTVEQATLNFNKRNDRNATTPANPSIATDGSAIDHVLNTDGSTDISFEWLFTATGDASDIDGFILYMFVGTSSSAYSFGTTVSEENVYYLAPEKRAFLIQGVPSNKYYTFGIQSYRIVDKDINTTGVLKSTIIKSTATGENPYLPSSSVAFTGNVTGTINGTDASTVATKANGSLQLGTAYNKVTFDANAGISIYKYDTSAGINKARVIMNATDGIKISTTSDGSNYSDKLYIDTNGVINAVGISLDAGSNMAGTPVSTYKSGLSNDSANIIDNFNFLDWSATALSLPVSYTGQQGVAPTKVVSDNSFGNALQYVVADATNAYMNTYDISKTPFYQYMYIEATFKLVSGNIDGAGILFRYFDSVGTGILYDNKLSFKALVPSPIIGKWYTVSKVFKMAVASTNNFSKYSTYIMGGWSGFETVTAKTIQFDSVCARPATEQEKVSYEAGMTISAKEANWDGAYGLTSAWKMPSTTKTTINGARIETGTIYTNQMFVGDFTNYCPNPTFLAGTGDEWTSGITVIDSTPPATGTSPVPTGSSTKYVGRSQQRDLYCGQFFPVEANDQFFVSFDCVTPDSTYAIGIGIHAQKADGTNTWLVVYRNPSSTWGTVSGNITIPSGFVQARTFVQINATANFGTWYFTNVLIKRRMTGELVVDGTLTFEKSYGGTLRLGGTNNQNGRLEVYDSKGEVIADLDGDEGGFDKLTCDLLYANNIENINEENFNCYVDPLNGDDSNSGLGGWAFAKKSVQAMVEKLPKLNYGQITIFLHYDNSKNVYENIFIEGFHGAGSITIDFQTTTNTLHGYFRARGNTNHIILTNATINTTSSISSNCVYWDRSIYGNVTNCKIYGNNSTKFGVFATSGALLYVVSCEIYNVVNDCIHADVGGTIVQYGCSGKGNAYGLSAQNGGEIKAWGTCPGGGSGTVFTAGDNTAGEVINKATVNYGTATATTPPPTVPAPPPTSTTQWTSTSNDNWSTSGYWSGDGAKQGNWGYGRRTGFWWWGTTISTALTGKTISSMRVKVTRASTGGNSSAVQIQIRHHNTTAKPSGAPSDTDLSSEYVTVSLTRGQSAWVTLPSSFYSYFKAGTAKGVGIYVASDSSSYYAMMNGQAIIEATYS